MALRVSFEELQLELVLQIRERLIDVLVPPLHEPLRPFEMRLELAEIPPQKFTDFVFLTDYLVDCHGVICALSKRLDVRRIDLLVLGGHVKTRDTDQLEVLSRYMLVASLKIGVDVLYGEVEGLPLQAVVG